MANETTIKANIEVTGLSELERAKTLLESLKTGMSGMGNNSLSGFSEGITKAADSANKLKETLSSIKDVGGSGAEIGTRLAEGINRATDKATDLEAKLKAVDEVAGKDRTNNAMAESLNKARENAGKLTDSYRDVANAQRSMAEMSRKVADTNDESFRNSRRGYEEQREAIRATQLAQREQIQSVPREEESKPESKLKSAVKEAFGMYTLGQLGANAVMGVADKIHDTITGGWDTIKQQSAASAQWQTYTDSARQGVEQSQRLQQMSLAYGQDYGLTNESARQIYMGLEGSNKVARTNRLTQDVLKAIDAEGMSDFDAERFTKFGIGNAFDTGKITQTNLNQMSNYAPQLKDAWVKSLQEAGKKVKNYGDVRNLAHTGKLHSEDLERALNYAGSHEWRDASKNLLSTIPGMLRVLNTGSKQVVGQFEKSFMTPLGKAMEPYAKRMSDWFTSGNGKQVASQFGKQMSQYTAKGLQVGANAFKGLSQIQSQLKPLETSFGSGFVSQIKSFSSAIKEGYSELKNIGSSMKNALPQGLSQRFSNFGQSLAQGAGKITAFMVSMRGLSKLPAIGGLASKIVQPIMGLTSKIPLIGKTVTGIISKITGIRMQNNSVGSKMMSAANTMQSAADKMNGAANNERDLANNDRINGTTPLSQQLSKGSEDRYLYTTDEHGNTVLRKNFHGNGAFVGEYDPNPYSNSLSRVERYHNTEPVSTKGTELMNRGQALLKPAGDAAYSRVNENISPWQRFKGNMMYSVGDIMQTEYSAFQGMRNSISERLGGTMLGQGFTRGLGALQAIGSAGRSALGAIGERGQVGLNGLFAATDAMNAMSSTRPGTLNRHRQVGGAIGGGVGGAIGATLGSFTDEFTGGLGTVAGGMAGNWIGNKIGNWAGGMFGGSTGPGSSRRVAMARQAAINARQRSQFVAGYGKAFAGQAASSGQLNSMAGAAWGLQKMASKSDSSAIQGQGMDLQSAIQSGSFRQVKAAQQKVANSLYRESKANYKNADEQQSKAYNKAYDDYMNTHHAGLFGSAANKSQLRAQARKAAKDSSGYKEATKQKEKADKQLSEAKGYRDRTGASKKAASSAAKDRHKEAKDTKDADKKISKSSKEAGKGRAKSAKNAAKAAVKAQKKASREALKDMKKQQGNLKKALKAQSKGQKKELSAMRKAQSKAFKNMNKDAQKSLKRFSKAVRSGMKRAQKAAKSGIKRLSKNTKQGLKGMNKAIKSAMKKARTETKRGTKQMAKAVKSGMKRASKQAKTAMKSLSKAVKSGMKRAQRAVKTGSRGIARSMKSGLKKATRSAKTSMKGISKAVKSGMRRARSAARSGSRGIGRAIRSGLKSASRRARSAMRGVARAVRSGMRRARSAARSGARGIGRAIRSGLRSASRGARSAMRGVARAVRSGMRRARSAARSGARGIGNAIRSGLRRASSGARSAMNRVATAVRSGMNRARSAARSGANGIANAVRSGLNRMASAARSATSRVASAIRSGLNQAKSAATSAANGIANAIKSGLDRAVSAAQSATSRIASTMSQIGSAATAAAGKVQALASAINSLHSKTVTITVNVSRHGKVAAGTPGAVSAFTNHLAKGTPFFRNGNSSLSAGRGWASNGGAKGGMYLVNDAKGADYVEAFRLKNGLTGLFPKKRNLMVPLPEGTQVLNAKDTKRMFPRLEHGTRKFNKGSHGKKSQGINVHNNFNITVNSKGGKVNPAKIAKRVAEEIGDRMNQLFAQLEV